MKTPLRSELSRVRIICLSDTHGLHNSVPVPKGDILLFAGDLCGPGNLWEVKRFGTWLRNLPHPHKIVIAGNHDWAFEQDRNKAAEALGEGIIYLQDSSVEVEGLKIYGSPWQPEFCNWAFNLKRGPQLEEIWSRIPQDTDILITHGPPYGILDKTYDGRSVGCQDLSARLAQLPKLKAHIFGHIHEAYGREVKDGCVYLNASICDLEQREAVNPPWLLEL